MSPSRWPRAAGMANPGQVGRHSSTLQYSPRPKQTQRALPHYWLALSCTGQVSHRRRRGQSATDNRHALSSPLLARREEGKSTKNAQGLEIAWGVDAFHCHNGIPELSCVPRESFFQSSNTCRPIGNV